MAMRLIYEVTAVHAVRDSPRVFLLTATNPSNSPAMTLGPNDEIVIDINQEPEDPSDPGAVKVVGTPGLVVTRSESQVARFTIRATSDYVLKPGDTIKLEIVGLRLEPRVVIDENIGGNIAGAATTLLSYQFLPTQAFVSLSTSFTFIATNSTDNPITLKSGRRGDMIQVTFPMPPAFTGANALIDAANFTGTPTTPGFLVGKQSVGSPTYNIQPSSDQTLQPGAQIKVVFNPVTVNATPGTPTIQIVEYIGTSTGSTGVDVQKLPQQLSIIAWLDPYLVGLGEPSTLYWQSFAGNNVNIINFPNPPPTRPFPIQGQPPYPGNTVVTLTPTEAERTYTAQVTTNDNRHAQVQITLAHQGPEVTSFQSSGPLTVGPADQVPLTWTTLYSPTVFLRNSAGGQTQVAANPLTPVKVTPGTDALDGAPDWQSIPVQVAYTLVATGYGGNALSSPINVNISPVKVLYLKYLQMDGGGNLSVIAFATDPPWPAAQFTTVGTGGTYSVYQPGGAVTTLYLGAFDTVHPQIQYFNAKAESGGSYTLSWVTANATGLTLTPGSSVTPGKGSTPVKPSVTTNYVLTATAKSGETVTSTLTIKV
jgi:hypothetical protein